LASLANQYDVGFGAKAKYADSFTVR